MIHVICASYIVAQIFHDTAAMTNHEGEYA
jgi:hypothetical protein